MSFWFLLLTSCELIVVSHCLSMSPRRYFWGTRKTRVFADVLPKPNYEFMLYDFMLLSPVFHCDDMIAFGAMFTLWTVARRLASILLADAPQGKTKQIRQYLNQFVKIHEVSPLHIGRTNFRLLNYTYGSNIPHGLPWWNPGLQPLPVDSPRFPPIQGLMDG